MTSRWKAKSASGSSAAFPRTKVRIHVYDLLPPGRLSSTLWWLGSAPLHSGVVVGDREYAYGGHDIVKTSGVYWTSPGTAPPGGTFRVEIVHGFSVASEEQVQVWINEVSDQFLGPSYDLLHRNCNHFTDVLCRRLTSKPAPSWLNRAANIGHALPCFVPHDWMATVDDDDDDDDDDDENEHSMMMRRPWPNRLESDTAGASTAGAAFRRPSASTMDSSSEHDRSTTGPCPSHQRTMASLERASARTQASSRNKQEPGWLE